MARIRPGYAAGKSAYTGEAAAADSLDVAIEIPDDIPEETALVTREPETRPETPDVRHQSLAPDFIQTIFSLSDQNSFCTFSSRDTGDDTCSLSFTKYLPDTLSGLGVLMR